MGKERATAEVKRKRLASLYKFINGKRRITLEEAQKYLKEMGHGDIDERQVRNYLYDLEALGLIVHEEGTKTYVLEKITKKREFATKADHELALEHSKKLLFSTSEMQLFDLMNPNMWADDLAFNTWRHELLRQHLKTGYFDDYLLLEKYKRITPIPPQYRQIEPAPRPPHGSWGPSIKQPSSGIMKHGVTENKRESELEKSEQKEDEKIVAARQKLRKEITEKLCALMYRVEHGIPLEGECDCCPHLHITIKDEKH